MMLQGRRPHLTADLWAKAGELEKQFASYKQKVEKTDQEKDESTTKEMKEQKNEGRGDLYEKYMKIRDVKLKEGWIAKMEKKDADMAVMWDQLEKSQTEMEVRFGASKTVGPIRAPSPTVLKNTVQRKDLLTDEEKGGDLTPRSTMTIASTKRQSSLSRNSTPSNSRPSSTSRNSTIPRSPRRSNSNRAKSLPRLDSPSRSPAIFSDLRKDNKTPPPITPRARILTKSQSSIVEKSNSRGAKKPPRISSTMTPRIRKSGSFELKQNDQISLEETLEDEIMDTYFEPVIGIIDDNVLPSSDNYMEVVINKEKEEEIPSARSSLSHDSNKISSVRSSLSHESNNHVESDIPINVNTGDDLDAYLENQQVDTGNNLLNPPIDKAEDSANESSRSWYSNLESSFSNRSMVDPAIDSPILSPRGSTSFRFLPESTPIRVRKKWEARSSNSPRGIKKLLSFGRKSKGNQTLTIDSTSRLSIGSSSFIEDESANAMNGTNRVSWASYESNESRNDESENGDRPSVYQQDTNTISQQVHASAGSQTAFGANYEQKGDQSSVNSQKVHRSFFHFPPFLCKGTESRIR